MKKLLIVYFSRTGNTEAMAMAVYEGAESAGASVSMKKAADTAPEDLAECDAIAFGTPNNFSYMSAGMKDLFERAWLTVRDKLGDKPYTSFGSAGAGGRQGLDSIDSLCTSFKLRKAFEGVMTTRSPSADVLEQCKELGKKLAQS